MEGDFQVGPWLVQPKLNAISGNSRTVHVEPKAMQVLVYLAEHAGDVMPKERIIQAVWAETFVTDDVLTRAISELRRAFEDDPHEPRFIQTIPKGGYRLIAPVEAVAAVARAPAVYKLIPAVAVLAVLMLAAYLVRPEWFGRKPGIAFNPRDWVLISSFENRTGEAVFDGTLEYALERELCNSKFVNVVPRERINDTLVLMKKPPNTRLDAGLGREICQRDGGIRVLLTGRVEKLDETYLLSVAVVDPTDGVSVASLTEEATGQNHVPAILRRLSNRVRERLGEELPRIARGNQALEKATTPSLRALQLYSHGMALVNERKWEQAAALLDQAVKEDPKFASAHIYLAHCYSNVDKEDQAAPHYRKAFELADTTTDRERYFILGSYYGRFMPDPEKELRSYEILVRLYPDHYWGIHKLVFAYLGMGLPKQAIQYACRLAEMRPNDLGANHAAAYTLFQDGDNPALARPYALRARALLTPESLEASPHIGRWVLLFPPTECWQRGNAHEAKNELSQMARVVSPLTTKTRDSYMQAVGLSYLALGNLRSAEELFKNLSESDDRNFDLALTALARDDQATLRRYSRRLGGGGLLTTLMPPILMARAGLLSEAQEAIAMRERSKEWIADPELRGFVKVMKGELALAQGQRSKAIVLLQEGLQAINRPDTFTFFMGVEALARAWEDEGNLPEAIAALEKASAARPRVQILLGFAWMRIQWRLAQLYRKVGREQDARRIEDELRGLLANADTDFPMLVQLKRLQEAAATPIPK
ncbi:MAG: winged helix-turn-helix domain-containing protein [Acidobacteriia bacterium]|nr:winged helix-turn-helix domain-containing protein [Terriglobia bacterium]